MSRIRLSKSSVGTEEVQALAEVIGVGYLGMGAQVQKFEQVLKEYLQDAKHVICMNTGTSALHAALECYGIQQGDEVILPTITYVASFQAVAACGAVPVACDIDPDDLFMDLAHAESLITPKTKAIMPVHYASNSKRMNAVYALAKAHNLKVVEDAAHSFGCVRDGVPVGVDGDVLCFSFDGIKNITCGEGGAIVTKDDELAEKLRNFRLLGVMKDTEKRYSGQRSWEFDVDSRGFRYHMSNLNAAIGLAQMGKRHILWGLRQKMYSHYREKLKSVSGVQMIDFQDPGLVPHLVVIKLERGSREELMAYLLEHNIESGVHYYPNHKLSFFRQKSQYPIADAIEKKILSLPMHPEITFEQIDYIAEKLRSYYSGK